MNYGPYAFTAGVVIAVLAGLLATQLAAYSWLIGIVLLILGIIVGFLNIKDKEVTNFLVATIALMSTSAIADWVLLDIAGLPLGTWIVSILSNIGFFVAPAAVIVALKAVYAMAKD